MATFQVAPPEPFSFNRPEEWPKWIRRFERFRIASGLDGKAEEAQVNTLLYSMGNEGDDILRSFSLSEEDQKKYNTVKAKFDGHFVKRRNTIFERAKFNSRRQEQGEPVDAFITALYGLAEHCNYAGLHDEMIRDRIVVGICDSKLSEKLQLDPDLTLDKAVAQVRQAEAVKQQQPVIRGDATYAPVGAVHKASGNSGRKMRVPTPGCQETCHRCGYSPPHDFQRCSARNELCHRCNKPGHFKAVCKWPSDKPRHIQQVIKNDSDETDDFFLGIVQNDGAQSEQPWAVTLRLNSSALDFHIDTGAEVTVITTSAHRKIGCPPLLPWLPPTTAG